MGETAIHTLPQMLLVGAADRNAGKTELACRVIRRWAPEREIVAVKVTTVRRADGTCPRGGQGCGVCSSLAGEYCITDEADAPATKDTGRLRDAGAHRVFWLRVLASRLNAGLAALLEQTGPDALTVCESNSLRRIVRPGVFLMVRSNRSGPAKPSAAEVLDAADRIVVFDGQSFDFELDALRPVGGGWGLREAATAVLIAGGQSTRMGAAKALLHVHGKRLIEYIYDQLAPHFAEVLISADAAGRFEFMGVPVVVDPAPGCGPLMGLAAALRATTSDLNLMVACDVPDIPMPLARRMLREAAGYEAVVPRYGGKLEPLFAVYRRSLASPIEALLAAGHRKVAALLERCRVRYMDLPEPSPIINLNTPEEYRAYVNR